MGLTETPLPVIQVSEIREIARRSLSCSIVEKFRRTTVRRDTRRFKVMDCEHKRRRGRVGHALTDKEFCELYDAFIAADRVVGPRFYDYCSLTKLAAAFFKHPMRAAIHGNPTRGESIER